MTSRQRGRQGLGLTLLVLLVVLAGCARVPRESVELSVTLGRDLAEVHRAHRELATRYFQRMRTDIEQFIDEQYRPFIVRDTMQRLDLVEKVRTAPDPLTVMDVYVTEVTRRIDATRRDWLRTLDGQERELLQAVDEAYLALQNANSIVTGHLASVVRVHEAQAALLERAGLEHLRETVSVRVATLSDGIADLVEKARTGELAVDRTHAAIETLLKTLGTGGR